LPYNVIQDGTILFTIYKDIRSLLQKNAAPKIKLLNPAYVTFNKNLAMANFQDIIASDVPVLVDFSAEWCGPCKMMPPILKQVKDAMGDKVKIIKIDIDKNPQAANAYKVQSVPTLMIFKKGQTMWRQSGVVQAGQLQSVIQQFV
jgi:thioredoxin 1